MQEPKVVVIGGGTGQSIFLRGLKKYTQNITAIVTVSDDGGGSGKLREDLGMLPPGDIRNCILALADTEPEMEKIMQYRFPEGCLAGQNFGNLFIAALNGVYGSFELAVSKISEILAVKGKVVPVTLEDTQIYGVLEDGSIIKGESAIPLEVLRRKSKIKKIFMQPSSPQACIEVLESIKEADIIVIGPGSLYTSIIPNFLVKDVVSYIQKSNAMKIYVCNVMTQPGETQGYRIKEHVKALIDYLGENVLQHIIINKKVLSKDLKRRYNQDDSYQILMDETSQKYLKEKNIAFYQEDIIQIVKGYIRHDSDRVSEKIMKIFEKNKSI